MILHSRGLLLILLGPRSEPGNISDDRRYVRLLCPNLFSFCSLVLVFWCVLYHAILWYQHFARNQIATLYLVNCGKPVHILVPQVGVYTASGYIRQNVWYVYTMNTAAVEDVSIW